MHAGDLTPEQLERLQCQLGCLFPGSRTRPIYDLPQIPAADDPTFDPLSDPLDEPFPEEYR